MIVRWENEHDYYLAHLHQDMFGDWVLTRVWGQIGTQFGGIKHTLVSSLDEASILLDDIRHIQESRGMRKVLEADALESLPEPVRAQLQRELPF